MKHLRLIFGLALVPLCTLIGIFIPLGRGSAVVIGLVLGIVLSYLFLTYGPGKKSALPTSYYLSHQHQANGGINQQAIEVHTIDARVAAQETHSLNPRP